MKDRTYIANKIFMAVLALEFLGCFLFQSINETAARFTSLASFIALVIVILCYVNPIKELFVRRNPEIWVAGIASVIALVNLFVIGSNKGAFLTACDVLLAMYAAGFMEFSETEKRIIYSYGALLLIWWYGTVRWYFNFNMVGMIFMITCSLTLLLLESIKAKYGLYYLSFVQVVLYVTSTLLCLLYHARCVLCGMLIFGILYIVYPLVKKTKLLWALLIFSATAGSLLFTLLYILLSKTGMSVKILYKDILSGRQDIWSELWGAFAKMPLTGIGSSYHIKSFFIFEVHNGLFDILAVHGILVFAGVLFMLCRRLWKYFAETETDAISKETAIAFAAIYAILFTSFFENFFINSPYLLVLVILLTVGMRRS